jgi:hypothetical protein
LSLFQQFWQKTISIGNILGRSDLSDLSLRQLNQLSIPSSQHSAKQVFSEHAPALLNDHNYKLMMMLAARAKACFMLPIK